MKAGPCRSERANHCTAAAAVPLLTHLSLISAGSAMSPDVENRAEPAGSWLQLAGSGSPLAGKLWWAANGEPVTQGTALGMRTKTQKAKASTKALEIYWRLP